MCPNGYTGYSTVENGSDSKFEVPKDKGNICNAPVRISYFNRFHSPYFTNKIYMLLNGFLVDLNFNKMNYNCEIQCQNCNAQVRELLNY